MVLPRSLVLVIPLAGCGIEPSETSHAGFVLEPIDRLIELTEPVPATLYVEYRAVSYPGHVVEYGVEVDGEPLTVVYAIDPAARLPLSTRIYERGSARPLLGLYADDHALEIVAGDAAVPALAVDGYLDPPRAEVTGAAVTFPPSLRPILDAVLPARSEVAPVPAFWQNLDQPAGDGEIGQVGTSGRPLLSTWSAPVSLLGALFLQAPCLALDDGYGCPCLHVDLPAVGAIDTCPDDRR